MSATERLAAAAAPAPRRSAARRALDVAGLLLAGGLAYWAFARADPDALAAAFREGDRTWIAAALGVLALGHGARVYRWSALCGRAGVSGWAAAVAGPPGLLANTLLPFRLGEGVRLALQRRLDGGARLGALAGLTLVERCGDLFGILALVAAGAAAGGRYVPAVLLVGGTAIGFAVLQGAARFAARRKFGSAGALVARVAALLLAQGPAMLAHVGAVSLAAWAGDAVAVALLARAFGAQVPAGIATSAAGWTALGVALPTAPAGLGTHQAIMAWALGGAAPLEAAIAVSIAMLGLISIAQLALSLVALAALAARPAVRAP